MNCSYCGEKSKNLKEKWDFNSNHEIILCFKCLNCIEKDIKNTCGECLDDYICINHYLVG